MRKVHNGERIHISLFGRVNAGKSSLINAMTKRNISLVSNQKGTTTDVVRKAMEIPPLGPILLHDTPGLDDNSNLGELRMKNTMKVIENTDIAIVVIDGEVGLQKTEMDLINLLKSKEVKVIEVYSKADLVKTDKLSISSITGEGIDELLNLLSSLNIKKEKKIICDLLKPNSRVVLVTPIDKSAPKGRLILPQQQVLRELLDHNHSSLVIQVPELQDALKWEPDLIITDSQAFKEVSKINKKQFPLTGFSILFAKYKGDLELFNDSIKAINNLKDGDEVLIAEGCTHHRTSDDIGTVKIPKWLKDKTKKNLNIRFSSGKKFSELELENVKLIIMCGSCMLNEKEVKTRIEFANEKNIPITNYGIFIADVMGILKEATEFVL